MKKVLLTGGNGFIGKNILESFLAQKHEIVAPRSFELDLTNTEKVDEFFRGKEFDVVIHSAVKPGHRNAEACSNLFYLNTRMFQNLERHKSSYGKFLNLGSGAIYCCERYSPKMSENYAGEFIPKDEHGFCKYVIGKQIENLDNFVDLRLFGVFGKYEDYAIRFISNSICKAIFGLPITIKQNRKFDYLYISDLMPILDFFIEKDVKYKAYNITPDKSFELFDIAEKVKNFSEKNLPVKIAKNALGLEYSGDNSRLREEFKEINFTPFENSISELFNWYKQNKRNINKEFLLFDK